MRDPYGRYYLHYYYESSDNAYSQISDPVSSYVNQIGTLRRRMATNSSACAAVKKWGEMLERGTNDDSIRQMFQTTAPKNTPSDMTVRSAEQARSILYGNNLATQAKTIQEFSDLLTEKMLPHMTGLDTKTFEEFERAALAAYASDNSESIGAFARKAMRSMLANKNSQFILVPDATSQIANLNAKHRRLLSYATYLHTLANSIDSGHATSRDDQDLFDDVRNAVQELVEASNANLGRIASAQGFMRALNVMAKTTKDAEAKMVKSISGGKRTTLNKAGLGIECDVSMPKHGYSKVLADLGGVDFKKTISTANVTLTVGDDSVEQRIGFVAESGKRLNYGLAVKGKTYTLKQSTPLLTLMLQGIGYTDSDMHDIVQLAVGHPGKSVKAGEIESKWDDLMEKVQADAFLSALTGLQADENVTYYVVNGKLISVEDIVSQVARYVLTGNTNPVRMTVKSTGAGVKRSSYVALNRWIGDRKDVGNAIERSGTTNESAAKLMQSTKVRVDLNLRAIQSLLKGI